MSSIVSLAHVFLPMALLTEVRPFISITIP